MGFFLRGLRELGYDARGLDVGDFPAALAKADGFPTWYGPLESLPADWVDPNACACFFVLHHLEDPLAFIQTIRAGFPGALLLLAVYHSLREQDIHPAFLKTGPPRTYTWWGPHQLHILLERAGYQPHVFNVRPSARDGVAVRWLPWYTAISRRVPQTGRLLTGLYYRTLPLWGYMPTLWLHWRGDSNYLIIVGHPRGPSQGAGNSTSPDRAAG